MKKLKSILLLALLFALLFNLFSCADENDCDFYDTYVVGGETADETENADESGKDIDDLANTDSKEAPGQDMPVGQPTEHGKLEVHFIDVGQADAILVLCNEKALMIDGGNVGDSSVIVTYLRNLGVDYLDYMICTHAHEDHVGGLSGALNACKVGAAFCPVTEYDTKAFSSFIKYLDEQGLSVTVPRAGDNFMLGGAFVEFLAPRKDYEDTNNTSIVIRLSYGSHTFIFTGDAEYDSEIDMIEDGCNLKCDVLKVGHHGSSTSTSYRFLYEADPDYAIISCGKDNDYGHPHEEVLSRLSDADVTVYRTDELGDIVCTSDGVSLSFRTGKGSAPAAGAEQKQETVQKEAVREEQQEQQTAGAQYIGNKNSKVLHISSCRSLPAEKNRVYFEDSSEALAGGYRFCSNCMG